MEKLFNESIEMLRNKQLETLKDVATEILNAPLEENHSLIIINLCCKQQIESFLGYLVS